MAGGSVSGGLVSGGRVVVGLRDSFGGSVVGGCVTGGGGSVGGGSATGVTGGGASRRGAVTGTVRRCRGCCGGCGCAAGAGAASVGAGSYTSTVGGLTRQSGVVGTCTCVVDVDDVVDGDTTWVVLSVVSCRPPKAGSSSCPPLEHPTSATMNTTPVVRITAFRIVAAYPAHRSRIAMNITVEYEIQAATLEQAMDDARRHLLTFAPNVPESAWIIDMRCSPALATVNGDIPMWTVTVEATRRTA